MADPRCTGRMQGRRGTVHCRWCRCRFPVWSRTPGGGKRSWHGVARAHADKEHPLEAARVRDPLDLVTREERANG